MVGISIIFLICTLFVVPMLRLFYVQMFNFFHAKTTNERFGRMGQFNTQLTLRQSGTTTTNDNDAMTENTANDGHGYNEAEDADNKFGRNRMGTQVNNQINFANDRLMGITNDNVNIRR